MLFVAFAKRPCWRRQLRVTPVFRLRVLIGRKSLAVINTKLKMLKKINLISDVNDLPAFS